LPVFSQRPEAIIIADHYFIQITRAKLEKIKKKLQVLLTDPHKPATARDLPVTEL